MNLKRYNAMVVGDTEERKINLMGFVPPKVVAVSPVGKRRKHKNTDLSNENNKSPNKKTET